MPFDPTDRARGTEGTLDPEAVGALLGRVDEALRDAFGGEVWVRGQIRDLHRARSGHVYFVLAEVDDDDRVTDRIAVMLSDRARPRVNRILRSAGDAVRMSDGVEIRIRARVTVYGPRGQLQLAMSSIDPTFTLGRLAAQRSELLERLRQDGLLDANKARPLPLAPLRLGLVTSAGSAADADVRSELHRSGFAFEVVAADVPVQGPAAAGSIADAIGWLDSIAETDVIVVVRGGGATTDLAPFDAEIVARAIAASTTPVISGVGHETDRTVTDEVAAVAVKTPTAAAAVVVGRVTEARRRSEELAAAAHAAARDRVAAEQRRVATLASRAARSADSAAATEARRLQRLGDRATQAAHRRMDREAVRLVRAGTRAVQAAATVVHAGELTVRDLSAQVERNDPARALRRGWALVTDADGRWVRVASDLSPGESIRLRLSVGTVDATVTGVQEPGEGEDGDR